MQDDRWNVLHVIANREKRVAQHLTARSIEHYLPTYRERSRWSDRIVTIEHALFPGYVFVRFSPEARIELISTPNVLALLGNGAERTVSNEEVTRIREGMLRGLILLPHSGIVAGSPVRVRRGVFEGASGIAVEFRGQWRVVLTLTAIRQSFSLEVDLNDLEVLPATQSSVFGACRNRGEFLSSPKTL